MQLMLNIIRLTLSLVCKKGKTMEEVDSSNELSDVMNQEIQYAHTHTHTWLICWTV